MQKKTGALANSVCRKKKSHSALAVCYGCPMQSLDFQKGQARPRTLIPVVMRGALRSHSEECLGRVFAALSPEVPLSHTSNGSLVGVTSERHEVT